MASVQGRQQFIATVNDKMLAGMVHDIVQMHGKGISKMKSNFDYRIVDIFAIAIVGSFLDFRSSCSEPRA